VEENEDKESESNTKEEPDDEEIEEYQICFIY
jgi:hypothetical protein